MNLTLVSWLCQEFLLGSDEFFSVSAVYFFDKNVIFHCIERKKHIKNIVKNGLW